MPTMTNEKRRRRRGDDRDTRRGEGRQDESDDRRERSRASSPASRRRTRSRSCSFRPFPRRRFASSDAVPAESVIATSLVGRSDPDNHPHDGTDSAWQATAVGALASACQNALGTHSKGAVGFFTRTGGTIGFFGTCLIVLCAGRGLSGVARRQARWASLSR